MIISVINHAYSKVSDDELQQAIRSINRQISEDFEPYWGFGGKLRLEGRTGNKPSENPIDMRGDAIIYLWDTTDPEKSKQEHKKYYSGIPYGMVYTEISSKLNESWSVALSHEALELLGDPFLNLFAMGPHPVPKENKRQVFHCFEMCDAVQSQRYKVEDVEVSNFVLPLYFDYNKDKEIINEGARRDFLGVKNNTTGTTLQPFNVNPGGTIVVWDSDNKVWYTHAPDQLAVERKAIKDIASETRRSTRYQQSI